MAELQFILVIFILHWIPLRVGTILLSNIDHGQQSPCPFMVNINDVLSGFCYDPFKDGDIIGLIGMPTKAAYSYSVPTS